MEFIRILVLFVVFILTACSPFEKRREGQEELRERLRRVEDSLELGKDPRAEHEYARYWKELLANNPELAKQFKEMPPEEIAKFGDRFAHKQGNIRSQIDELQRLNLERMKNVNGGRNNQFGINRGPYNDPSNDILNQRRPTADDISRRMEEHRKIQDELDRIRKDEFKNFERRVEDVRRKKLREMDEAQRLREEQRLEELAKKHRDHEKLQHPASKQQLEDIWQNQDGLADEQFNPKTFFYLHDKNGDGFWDIYETEALFMKEIRKAYADDTNNMMMQEELAEMREHVFGEIDKNRDGLISLSEFINYSDKDIFDINDEWKPLEERDQFVVPENFDGYDYDYEETAAQEEQMHLSQEEHPTDFHTTDSQNPDSHAADNQNPDTHAAENQNPDSHTNDNQNPDSHTNNNHNSDTHATDGKNTDSHTTNPDTKTASDNAEQNEERHTPNQVQHSQTDQSKPVEQTKHDVPGNLHGVSHGVSQDSPQNRDGPDVAVDDIKIQQGNL